ncbi:MAG: S8 family serine peptidase [Cellvibrionaceae bacterium]
MPDAFINRTSPPQRVPPKLVDFQPRDCYSPGKKINIKGDFQNYHTKHNAVIDGQGGHFHLDILEFGDELIIAQLPVAIKSDTKGPYALFLEEPNQHEPDSNALREIWLCEEPVSQLAPRTQDTSNRLDLNQSVVRTTATPQQPRAPQSGEIAANQNARTNSNTDNTNTENNNANNSADQTTGINEANATAVNPNNSGSLIRAALPAPPQITATTAANSQDDDSIESEQVVIITVDIAEANTVAAALAEYGGRIKTRQNMENLGMVLNVFRLPAGQSVNDLLPVLRQRFTNLWIDTNQRFSLMGEDLKKKDKKRYGQHALQWQPENANCHHSVRIGIVDTAVNLNHPALRNVEITSKNFLENGIVAAKPNHGTAVAALMVGKNTQPEFGGLLPNAKLFSAVVFRQRGKTKETTIEWLVQGIDWLVGQDVQFINLSLGGSRNLILELALRKVVAQGKIVIAAAGNDGANSPPVFPAAQEGIIAVTAIDAKNRRYRKANTGAYIDIAAPGVDVWVANERGKGHYQSGTSYSTPMATATLAARFGDSAISLPAIFEKLQEFSIDLGPPGRDSEFGWGLIQWPKQCQQLSNDS